MDGTPLAGWFGGGGGQLADGSSSAPTERILAHLDAIEERSRAHADRQDEMLKQVRDEMAHVRREVSKLRGPPAEAGDNGIVHV